MVRAALVIFLIVAIGARRSVLLLLHQVRPHHRSNASARPVFSNSAKIYALPRTLHDGDKIEAKEIAALLAPRRLFR